MNDFSNGSFEPRELHSNKPFKDKSDRETSERAGGERDCGSEEDL